MDQLLLLAHSLTPTIYGPKTDQKVSRNGQNCYHNVVDLGLDTSMTVWVVQRTQMALIRSRVIKKVIWIKFYCWGLVENDQNCPK